MSLSSSPSSIVYFGVMVAACWLPNSAWAQTPTRVAADPSRRIEGITAKPVLSTLSSDVTMSSSSPYDMEALAPASPGDNDMGEQLILREREQRRDFRFTADAFMFWTDNAAHVSAGEQEDTFWGSRVAATWQPRITNKLFADVGVAQDWFRYEKFDVLDFESLEATAGLIYVEPRLANTSFFVQYEYARLTHEFDEIMNSHSIRAGVQKVFLINWRNRISLGLMGDWDIANDVDALTRNEYTGNVSWLFKFTKKVDLTLSYLYTYFDYEEADRHDGFHGLGCNIVYTPKKWLQFYLSASYSFNDSNLPVYDYEGANLGGGLGVRIKF